MNGFFGFWTNFDGQIVLPLKNFQVTVTKFNTAHCVITNAGTNSNHNVAQQDAERAKFIVEKAQQEKRSIIVRAQGEAESAKLISFSSLFLLVKYYFLVQYELFP